MFTVILSRLEQAGALVLHAAWQAALLALLVIAATMLFGRRLHPRWRFALWLVVFVRLAVPVLPIAPWSVFQFAYLPDVQLSEQSASPESSSAPPIPRESTITIVATSDVDHARTEIAAAAQPRQESDKRLSLPSIAALLWVAGSILRPCIVLPRRLYESFSPSELRLVMLHELVHVRRRDVLTDRLATLVAFVHWFHPVGWIARYFLRRERELACDALVLDRATTSESAAYGGVILKTVESLSKSSLTSGLVGMFTGGSYSLLHRRIRMIAGHRKSTWASLAAGAAVVVALTLVGLTDAQTKKAEQAEQPKSPLVDVAEGMAAIGGVCLDENKNALPKVKVDLYRGQFAIDEKFELSETLESDADGRFQFKPVAAPPAEGDKNRWRYMIAATLAGRASMLKELNSKVATSELLQLTLGPAAKLQGRVTDPEGKPIAGASVFINETYRASFPDVFTALTDADGRYTIDDLGPIDFSKLTPVDHGDGTGSVATGCYFTISHPDFGQQRPLYTRIPDTIDVQLARAATIAGRVIDEVTGKPAAGATVFLQGTHDSETSTDSHYGKTDEAGVYRIVSLREGKYNVMVLHPERAAAAIDSLEAIAGKHTTAPDLTLIEDCWLEGRLIDAETEKPVVLDTKSGRRIRVGLYGPSRPKSGAACQADEVDDDGRFRMRVAPGLNFSYIMHENPWSRTLRREFYERGVEVKHGEVISLTFRILSKKAPKDPEPAPVSLPVPVAMERDAAAVIRDLGGWYQVDADNHVVEVNMVYHYTADRVRYDNSRVNSDEALRQVGAFPKLQRLALHQGQATDDALAVVGQLERLESLNIWDAEKVSDAGVRHLAGLRHLTNIHISNGQLSDESLRVFGGMPQLEKLSLQGNQFTDAGLASLTTLTHLKWLAIGLGKSVYSDAAAKTLSSLASLEKLDLQSSYLTDSGVAELSKLTNLEALEIAGSGNPESSITNASVDHLAKLPRLKRLTLLYNRLTIDGIVRLCELPALEHLIISTDLLTAEIRAQLNRDHPKLHILVARNEPLD